MSQATLGLPEVVTVKQLRAWLGLSVNTAYQYLRDGTIPSQRVGTRYIISRDVINAWLAAGTNEATP
jgi:excisionase family DNA binding protein